MSLMERFEQASNGLLVVIVGAIGSGCLWIVRLVFTNQKQIELLQQEITQRDALRSEDREALKEVKDDVKGLRADFHDFFRSHRE